MTLIGTHYRFLCWQVSQRVLALRFDLMENSVYLLNEKIIIYQIDFHEILELV